MRFVGLDAKAGKGVDATLVTGLVGFVGIVGTFSTALVTQFFQRGTTRMQIEAASRTESAKEARTLRNERRIAFRSAYVSVMTAALDRKPGEVHPLLDAITTTLGIIAEEGDVFNPSAAAAQVGSCLHAAADALRNERLAATAVPEDIRNQIAAARKLIPDSDEDTALAALGYLL